MNARRRGGLHGLGEQLKEQLVRRIVERRMNRAEGAWSEARPIEIVTAAS